MQEINLSINPIYLCNFRCHFCYLTKEQLSDKKTLPLDALQERLIELSAHRKINHIDLYGGEIGLLPKDYLDQMKFIIKGFTDQPINVVTNLSQVIPFFLEDDITLAVSWDYDCRQSYKKVLENIFSIKKDIHILMLASPQMLSWTDETLQRVIQIFNTVKNILSVEIKPYSSNQANQFTDTDKKFEDFIIRWLMQKKQMQKECFEFEFINEKLIEDSLSGKRNSWSDDHLYITPKGRFAVLEFDENEHEYFKELNNHSEYLQWCLGEKAKVMSNPVCNNCTYLGRCLSEHLRDVKPDSPSCSGFFNLLNWAESELGPGPEKNPHQVPS